MTITAQKTASTSQVNLQRIHNLDALKVLVPKTFTDEREKLQVFLTKLKLYIEFNKNRFRFKMNKKLFVTFFLKNAVFN